MHLDPITKNQITSSNVFLKKKPLLYWKSWSKSAKEYLKSSSDEIDLLLTVNLHHDKTIDFNKWLLQKLKTMHSSELIWLQEKSKQLKKFWDVINST